MCMYNTFFTSARVVPSCFPGKSYAYLHLSLPWPLPNHHVFHSPLPLTAPLMRLTFILLLLRVSLATWVSRNIDRRHRNTCRRVHGLRCTYLGIDKRCTLHALGLSKFSKSSGRGRAPNHAYRDACRSTALRSGLRDFASVKQPRGDTFDITEPIDGRMVHRTNRSRTMIKYRRDVFTGYGRVERNSDSDSFSNYDGFH
jgi:hypothetical protein